MTIKTQDPKTKGFQNQRPIRRQYRVTLLHNEAIKNDQPELLYPSLYAYIIQTRTSGLSSDFALSFIIPDDGLNAIIQVFVKDLDTHICKLEYYESTTKVIATSNTILVDVHDAYRGLRAPAKITYNDCGQITAFITCFVTHTGAYKLEPNTKFSNRAFSLAMDRLAANKFFTPSDMTVISSPTHSSQVDKGARPPTLGHVAKIPTLETSF